MEKKIKIEKRNRGKTNIWKKMLTNTRSDKGKRKIDDDSFLLQGYNRFKEKHKKI